jgi:hypothetical protein
MLAAAGIVLAGLIVSSPGAGAASPQPARAAVRSVVIDPSNPRIARVTATYICASGGGHLWVSVKQAVGGKYDPALSAEGSSTVAHAWSQTHPTNFVCDDTWHTQTFTVDQQEQGFGQLTHGVGWVQFCLIPDNGAPVFDQHWNNVQ